MAVVEEISLIPKQAVLGVCLDCDERKPASDPAARKVAITPTGRCSVCGSASIITPGAIREMTRQVRLRRKGRRARP